nr:glycosyltransferase family 2 protein [uncultured Pseudomonas sp.]
MSHTSDDTITLADANASFKKGNYVSALNMYASLLNEIPEMASHIKFNMKIAANMLVDPDGMLAVSKPVTTMTPLNQLNLNKGSDDNWVSTGEDPYFQMFFDKEKTVPAGWYLLTLVINAPRRRSSARFYVDYGQGYSEQNAFSMRYERDRVASRVVYIEAGAISVRFDPLEYQGSFKVNLLQWRAISAEQADEKILAQIDQVNGKDARVAALLESSKSPKGIAGYEYYDELLNVNPEVSSYNDWIENIEVVSLPSLHKSRQMASSLAYQPLISIVMPTYNTDDKLLRECLDSVIAQTYTNWELCIADDASTNANVLTTIKDYAERDTRIKFVARSKNGHISRTSNSALKLASGEYVALLDHDDMLSPHAMMFVAKTVNENPDAKIIYSDEDKLDLEGNRFDPHFKSDWNPELFYSQNYVSHLGIYCKSLITKIKGFRTGVEGSQDYDLMLRCLEHVRPEQILHLPYVLYHWRMVEGSTALSSDSKSYTTDAGVKSLKTYFQKINKGVKVGPGPVVNTYRVQWPLPAKPPLVSLLIPTRDRRSLTEVAVRSILEKTTYKNYEILILDNGSTEPDTLEFFEHIQLEYKNVRVIRYDYPFNYSAINNFGARHARGKVLGLVNNDVEVISPEWLTEMVSQALRPEIGCVGAKLYFSNDTVQHAGVICSLGGVAGHSHKHFDRSHPGYFYRLLLPQALSAVTAACLIVRKEVFDQVNGLDEINLKVAFNDVDFCLKVDEAGYRNVWTPYAELYHYESISRGAEDSPEKIKRFQAEIIFMKNRWSQVLNRDPYYNENLTKDREDFSLKLH